MRMQGMACKWDFFSLFPAYAGVIPCDMVVAAGVAPFPRVCGGDPRFAFIFYIDTPFSPRMRG